MFEVENLIRQKDIAEIASSEILAQYKNKTLFITGATGLLGSEIVFALLCANRLFEYNIKIIGLVRNIEKAKKIFSKVINNPNFELLVQDVNSQINYSAQVDFVIHTASVTSSKAFVEQPVETIMTAINGTNNVLDFAKSKQASFKYLSSLEAYGKIVLKDGEYLPEDFSGDLASTSVRSSYPLSKKMSENLCVAYASQYGLDVKIARLTQTFGAGIEKSDNRMFAYFAKSILNNENIVLHTTGKTVRNYCYITDAVIAILTILINGASSQVYNVANKSTTLSVKDIAQKLVSQKGLNVDFEIDNVNRGFNPIIKMPLDTTKLENLNWKAKVDLLEMFDRTISYLKEEN